MGAVYACLTIIMSAEAKPEVHPFRFTLWSGSAQRICSHLQGRSSFTFPGSVGVHNVTAPSSSRGILDVVHLHRRLSPTPNSNMAVLSFYQFVIKCSDCSGQVEFWKDGIQCFQLGCCFEFGLVCKFWTAVLPLSLPLCQSCAQGVPGLVAQAFLSL